MPASDSAGRGLSPVLSDVQIGITSTYLTSSSQASFSNSRPWHLPATHSPVALTWEGGEGTAARRQNPVRWNT